MLAVAVNVGVAGNHDNVDQSPDPAASEGQEHDDAGYRVASVESVNAKTSENNAEDERDQPTVLLLLDCLVVVVSLTVFRLWLERLPAIWAK